uniref:Uncharacterized protein n=1 Tax=Amphimedon queenslandica TaxID=400682 RepID=A0A1X7V4B2_AMPQE
DTGADYGRASTRKVYKQKNGCGFISCNIGTVFALILASGALILQQMMLYVYLNQIQSAWIFVHSDSIPLIEGVNIVHDKFLGTLGDEVHHLYRLTIGSSNYYS